MPDIKWIKITTEMFDDEKVRIIERMPEADTLLVIWIRLICLAGKVNAGGHIFLAPDLPYNDEQLAAVFNRELNTVRLALDTFQRLHMIEVQDNGNIYLPAFGKHQNIEGMERVRGLATARQQKKRERLKLKEGNSVTSRDSHAIDKNRLDKNIREDENEIWNNVLSRLFTEMNEMNFEKSFKDAVCFEIDDEGLVIGVRREDQAKHIEDYQRGLVERVIAEVTGRPLKLKIVLIDE